MQGKDKIGTYGENPKLRGTVVAACIICALVLCRRHMGIFQSYYDHFMVREIFQHPEELVIKAGDNNGLFWKLMNLYLILSYVASSVVLLFNIPYAGKIKLSSAVSDMIVYAFLALSIPVDFFVCMIGSRSYIVDYSSFIFMFEVLAFLFFAGAAAIHLKTCLNTRGDFEKSKFSVWIPILCILLISVPVSFLGRSIALSAQYAPNYGKFRIDSDESDPIVDNMLFNYSNNAVEYNGALYISCYNRFSDDPCSVDKLDDDGNYTHVADIEGVEGRLRFDIYNDNIYYLLNSASDTAFDYEIISRDISTGEETVIYSDEIVGKLSASGNTRCVGFNLFKIKDGTLYFNIYGDYDNSIYCIDLDDETYTREIYVSDIKLNVNSETYLYLYNYRHTIGGGAYQVGPDIYRDDVRYYFSEEDDYGEDGHLIITTTLKKFETDEHLMPILWDLYSSDQINGVCFYDGCFYFFEEDSGTIFCYDISTETISPVTSVDLADPYAFYTMYIYGDHILMVSDSDYFVVSR